MGPVSRFRSLTALERRAFLAASWMLPACAASLAMFGLARLQAFLAQRKARGAPILDARRIVYCVDAAARYSPVSPTCLVRSLVLQALLRRGGIASDLRIGVRLDEGRLDAHAWIEAGGVPLNDAPDVAERYGPFAGGLAARSFAR